MSGLRADEGASLRGFFFGLLAVEGPSVRGFFFLSAADEVVFVRGLLLGLFEVVLAVGSDTET